MRSLALHLAALVFFVPCVPLPCLAQKPSPPQTLENVLRVGADTSASRPTADAEAHQPDRPPRPQGALTRPTQGAQHADLDKAWAAHDDAVSRVADAMRSLLEKQFDEAASKGNLEEAEKWQGRLEAFAKEGVLPNGSETKVAAEKARADLEKARRELLEAYESTEKSLTMARQLSQARAIRNERQGLAQAASSPQSQKAARREVVLTVRVTSDWGQVCVLPAEAVAVRNQEVIKGEQAWRVSANEVGFAAGIGRRIDGQIRMTLSVAENVDRLTLRTHKGDIGAVYVEVSCGGKVLQTCGNEGAHGGNAQRSDNCRQDFQIDLPR